MRLVSISSIFLFIHDGVGCCTINSAMKDYCCKFVLVLVCTFVICVWVFVELACFSAFNVLKLDAPKLYAE